MIDFLANYWLWVVLVVAAVAVHRGAAAAAKATTAPSRATCPPYRRRPLDRSRRLPARPGLPAGVGHGGRSQVSRGRRQRVPMPTKVTALSGFSEVAGSHQESRWGSRPRP